MNDPTLIIILLSPKIVPYLYFQLKINLLLEKRIHISKMPGNVTYIMKHLFYLYL